ncbi:MAG: hypothetical protein K2G31_05755 [Clostridia bacterium]|nr:hypothetical protein [Clostridia bacterium]
MKKNLEKVFASASMVVAVILIMILLITAFGGIKVEEFKSDLVRGLFITLAILYIVLSGLALALMFIRSDVVKDVVVKSEKGGAVRVSTKVINKSVKQACLQLEGVKCKKVALVQDDYGTHLKVNIKVMDENTMKIEAYLRALLEEIFLSEFGFRFMSIETKIMVKTPKTKEDMDKLAAVASEKAEAIIAEREKELEEQAAENAENNEVAENTENTENNQTVEESAASQNEEAGYESIVEEYSSQE